MYIMNVQYKGADVLYLFDLVIFLSMCMLDKFHLKFNYKSKVSCNVSKTKNQC